MRAHLATALAATTLSLSLFACTPADDADELAGESELDGEGGKADGSGEFTYFETRPDLRRCASPWCAAQRVNRVNRTTTQCHDGSTAPDCYIASIDWSATGLDQTQIDDIYGKIGSAQFGGDGVQVILRGEIGAKDYGADIGLLGELHATEAWVAQTDGVSDGVFVKVADNGIRCITSPCPSLGEAKLNSTRSATIGDVDFEPSGATDEQAAAAMTAAFTADLGVIVAGYRAYHTEHGVKVKERTATQVFERVVAAPAPLGECRMTGCSGEMCADEDRFSTCQWRDEFACFYEDFAVCERQPDGACGWTANDELDACFADPPPF